MKRPNKKDGPHIFDVDMDTVDGVDPWIRVDRTRVVVATLTYDEMFYWHPLHHKEGHARGELSQHFKGYADLPKWIRERIAILNIAGSGEHVRGVGKRWHTRIVRSPQTGAPSTPQCYTLEFNCEEFWK